jgi:hypothetical protein
MTYDSGYENEPIGGGNPYYRCVHCKISDPQINGEVSNHAESCEYRQSKQGYVLTVSDSYDFGYELYSEELEIFSSVLKAQEALERKDVKGAMTYLKIDADKIRTVSPKLYAIIMKQP